MEAGASWIDPSLSTLEIVELIQSFINRHVAFALAVNARYPEGRDYGDTWCFWHLRYC